MTEETTATVVRHHRLPILRPLLADSVLALALTLVLTAIITADLERTGNAGPGAYLWALLLGALLLARRRAPRLVLALTLLGVFAYYIVDWPPIGIALPAVPALYSAAETGRTRWAAGAGVLLVAVAAVARVHEGLPTAYLYSYELLTNLALAAAAIALGVSVRSRREIRVHEERERRRSIADQRREAERRLQTERFRIARDLHDVIGHSISVVAVHSNVAAEAIGHDDARAAEAVERVRRAASDTMHELRTTVRLLRSEGGDRPERSAVGLAGIGHLTEEASAAGLEVTADIAVAAEEIDAAISSAVYRVVQEALTNVIRHSRAERVTVTLRAEDGRLRLRVTDSGPRSADVPALPERSGPGLSGPGRSGPGRSGPERQGSGEAGADRDSGGTGIEGMAERVRLLGGELSAAPTPEGFEVRAVLPMRLSP